MRSQVGRWTAAAALVAVVAVAVTGWSPVPTSAQALPPPASGIRIDPDDIGGIVAGANGVEPGVWVIAQTTTLPTRFLKIVVTDDQGRYVLPDLPRATYKIWVRGYGLVDSVPVTSTPGRLVNLQAVLAATPRDAAQLYPPSYWFSLLEVPDEKGFPGTGPEGNGISVGMKSQAQFIGAMKEGCLYCHQLGNKATREIPPEFGFGTGAAAWDRRVQSGQRGAVMSAGLNPIGRTAILRVLGEWTDRVAAGDLPQQVPSRPVGVERSIVISRWDWRGETGNLDDSVSTDKRNPSAVNANGKIYGVDLMNDVLGWVDPIENKAGNIRIPVRDADTPSFAAQTMPASSPYWGDQVFWNSPANVHNPMMDGQGRVWMTSSLRPPTRQPAFCKDERNPFARYFPLERSGRQTSYYDPRIGRTTLIDSCFSTHHLQFANDAANTLYFSGDADVIGWINTAVWDRTHDEEVSQGWCPMIVDTNGDGKIGAYTQPDTPVSGERDARISGLPYGIIPSPVDGSVWWATPGTPGRIARMEIGSNPPLTCRTEIFSPPFEARSNSLQRLGSTPRGIDIDHDSGVIWTALAGTSALASFDRRKCKVLNGPTATGDHCREGWMIYLTPSGPQFKGTKIPGTADMHYFNWVDQFNVLGLGKNVPIVNGSNSDALYALVNREFLTIRVPYPMGFYSKGVDGRIDDARTGWKGRGLYASNNFVPIWHQEGGKGVSGGVYRFQLRPDPLAH